MRPAALNPYFAGLTRLKGIGPKLERLFAHLLRPGEAGGARIVDLALHLPAGLIDRRRRPTVAELPPEGIVTVEVTVGRHRPPPPHNRRIPYRVDCFDDTGTVSLTFFQVHGDWLKRTLPEGETRFVSGRIDWYGGEPQMVHPDHVLSAEEFAAMPALEPVYRLTAGLSSKTVGRAVREALAGLPALPEWQDPAWLKQRRLPAFLDALNRLHQPEDAAALALDRPERLRLAYDEILSNQLALALMRRHLRQVAGRPIAAPGAARRAVAASLPYSLTRSQAAAVDDIVADMARPQRMLRLLQGDVGSGKTAVAVMALATAAEAGFQAALMVPTDILARQHHATIAPLAAAAGFRADILTGREKGAARREVLERIAAGGAQILIGTHALFQDDVGFRDLALVVIDEQHRFGVHQRLALQDKAGRGTDLLVMTATPIPRTLALTLYGDMEVSRLTEKPAGRQPVDTRVVPASRLPEVVEGLARAVAEGRRAYWVCPLVEESELVDKAAAEQRFQALAARLPGRVGLVHGRMTGPAKDAVMRDFQAGAVAVLVSTTVIEVGVDVPEASIMVVESAERFGLAQLHQLRGRVGRGAERASCVLIHDGKPGETARARLKIMRDTDDGFVIAEEDLRLRGAGEVLGTRQSGLPQFRLADLAVHADLLATARDDVELVLRADPGLRSPRGEALRSLLYLFERDEAVRLLAAG